MVGRLAMTTIGGQRGGATDDVGFKSNVDATGPALRVAFALSSVSPTDVVRYPCADRRVAAVPRLLRHHPRCLPTRSAWRPVDCASRCVAAA